MVLLVSTSLFSDSGVARHEKLERELDRINALNERLAKDNRRLAVEAKALRQNRRYIEHVIRDELGFVRSDEVVFILGGGSDP